MDKRANFFFLMEQVAGNRKEFGRKTYLYYYFLGQARHYRRNLPKLPG